MSYCIHTPLRDSQQRQILMRPHACIYHNIWPGICSPDHCTCCVLGDTSCFPIWGKLWVYSHWQCLLQCQCTADVPTLYKVKTPTSAKGGKYDLISCDMQMHGPRLIALTGCVSDLVAPAWGYMRVRAWSMPPILYTLVGMVSKTPCVSYRVLGACIFCHPNPLRVSHVGDTVGELQR